MTILYPLSPMKDDYVELRYSLRSVERYVGECEVVIVGEVIPDWITGVVWVRLGDIPGRKQLSIKRKIIAALRLVDEVLFLNDDLYLLRPWVSEYCYSGDLKHIGESGARPLRQELEKYGRPTKNFDTHSPLIYDRRFTHLCELYTADTIIKSMYCNSLLIEGVNRGDSKINDKMESATVRRFIANRPDFSTGPKGVKSVVPVLEELFSQPSKYEIV